jgi:hypothetical protein
MQRLQRESCSPKTSDRLERLFRCSTHWLARRTPLLEHCSNSPAKTNVENFVGTNSAMRWERSSLSSYSQICLRQLVESYRHFSPLRVGSHNVSLLTEQTSRHGRSGTTATDSRHLI